MRFFILTFLISLNVLGQKGIEHSLKIDTITFKYELPHEVRENKYPKLKTLKNSGAIPKINRSIRQELKFRSLSPDTLSFVEHIRNSEGGTIDEYIKKSQELLVEDSKLGEEAKDKLGCTFDIIYQTSELISIYFATYIEPYRFKGMYSSFILNYDLNTGKKLEFEDVFDIEHGELLDVMYSNGYKYWIDTSIEAGEHFVKLNRPNDNLEYHVGDLMELDVNEHMRGQTLDDRCISFSFKEIDEQLHFHFLFHCQGPSSIEYGIPLKELSQYIIHPTLRNKLNLWGQSIYDLIGMKFLYIGKEINLDNKIIINGGGVMLSQDPVNTTQSHAISYLYSDDKTYRIFQQLNPEKIILDVLEIDKDELQDGKILIEALCSDEKGVYDSELLAIVKKPIEYTDKFYTIIKAWRANRKTGEFEEIDVNKVGYCYNEGYGVTNE